MSANNSLLCPNCRRLVSRDQQRCPYCGISRPGSFWKTNRLFSALSDPDQVITLITAVSVGMYLLSLLLNPRSANVSFSPFDFLSPSNQSLLLLGSTGTVALNQLHRWWSLIAATYLHASLLHLLFNMIALRQIGPLVVREYGGHRMFLIYTLGGVGGYLLSYLAGIPFTVGASAAVCALIGATLYFGKSRGGSYGDNVYSQVGGWAMSIFVFGLMVPGINNWAHGGGMAAGALLGYLLGYGERARENFLHKLLGTVCLLLTGLILLGATISSLLLVFFRSRGL